MVASTLDLLSFGIVDTWPSRSKLRFLKKILFIRKIIKKKKIFFRDFYNKL